MKRFILKIRFNAKEVGKLLLIAAIFLFTMHYVYQYYADQGSIFFRLIVVFIALIYTAVCVFSAIFCRYTNKSYSFFMVACFLISLLWSLLLVWVNGFDRGKMEGLILFGMIGGLWLRRYSMNVFRRFLTVVQIIGIVWFLYLLLLRGIDWSYVTWRGYVWTDIFYWACVYWAVVPATLLAIIDKKRMLLSIAYWICGVLFELLFAKRYIIVDSILIIVMVIFLFCKSIRIEKGTIIKVVLGIGIVAVSVCMIMEQPGINIALDRTIARLGGTTVKGFDRFVEAKNFFADSNLLDVVLGRGFWSAHEYLDTYNPALHVGWANFIFKGGIPYFLVAFIPTITAYKNIFHVEKYSTEVKLAIAVLIIYSIRLMYLNLYSFAPEFIFFSWSCITVMDGTKTWKGDIGDLGS